VLAKVSAARKRSCAYHASNGAAGFDSAAEPRTAEDAGEAAGLSRTSESEPVYDPIHEILSRSTSEQRLNVVACNRRF
jgi:hypothetical protein